MAWDVLILPIKMSTKRAFCFGDFLRRQMFTTISCLRWYRSGWRRSGCLHEEDAHENCVAGGEHSVSGWQLAGGVTSAGGAQVEPVAGRRGAPAARKRQRVDALRLGRPPLGHRPYLTPSLQRRFECARPPTARSVRPLPNGNPLAPGGVPHSFRTVSAPSFRIRGPIMARPVTYRVLFPYTDHFFGASLREI